MATKESNKKQYASGLKSMLDGLTAILRKYSLNLILLIGLFGVLTSLYFSEAMDLPPCDLCWYQRILFYPIPVIAFVALILKDHKAHYYIFVLSLLGLPISIYQHLLKVTNIFQKDTPFCGTNGACSSLDWELWAGSGITIPFLCAIAFTGIIFLTGIQLFRKK